jgi:paraquat-inducible protein B
VFQNRVLNKLGERGEISCLKQDLHKERERSKELEKDMIILVEGRNREVEVLNNTIASLPNTLESTEMTNKCLRKEITQINSNNLLKANRNVSTQCRLDRPELINHRSNRGNRSTQQYSNHTDHKAIRNNRKNQGEIKLNNATKPSPRVVNPK